jgi:hypothetical protein
MEAHQHLPDANRLSILTATILLAYALTPFIRFPAHLISVQLPGVYLAFNLTFTSLVAVLVALLAAVGTDWLLQNHPNLGSKNTLSHGFLPAMTAWAIGVPISSLNIGVEWWIVFTLGGVLLFLVFLSEYIVVDFSDVRHALASMGLTATSFALFLILVIAVRGAGLRLYLVLPAVVIPTALVSLRALYLHLGGKWSINWSIAIALVIGQISMGLHYFPISPLSFGLILLGSAYALVSIAGSIEQKHSLRTLWIEPAVIVSIFWGLAFLYRK